MTESIIRKGTKDLGIRSELFADAMRKLVEKGLVTNRYLTNRFSISTAHSIHEGSVSPNTLSESPIWPLRIIKRNC